jgi:repressor LexA
MDIIQDIRGHNMFTQKEVQILKTIIELIDKKGCSPTVREIGREVNISSPTPVHSYLDKLESKGYISRAASCPRALTANKKVMKLTKLLE